MCRKPWIFTTIRDHLVIASLMPYERSGHYIIFFIHKSRVMITEENLLSPILMYTLALLAIQIPASWDWCKYLFGTVPDITQISGKLTAHAKSVQNFFMQSLTV